MAKKRKLLSDLTLPDLGEDEADDSDVKQFLDSLTLDGELARVSDQHSDITSGGGRFGLTVPFDNSKRLSFGVSGGGAKGVAGGKPISAGGVSGLDVSYGDENEGISARFDRQGRPMVGEKLPPHLRSMFEYQPVTMKNLLQVMYRKRF